MGKQWKQWQTLFSLAPVSLWMVTAAMKLKDICSWKESYDKPRQHIKKQWHYLSTKVHLVKAMVFPVVMYGCESWTIKKAESQRIDAFELWCWRRLFRDPWTARRSNQSILKEIWGNHVLLLSQECLLEFNLTHSLPSPSLSAFNHSHQGLFQWVSSSHQVAKVLELQLQHQSFQWIFRADFL